MENPTSTEHNHEQGAADPVINNEGSLTEIDQQETNEKPTFTEHNPEAVEADATEPVINSEESLAENGQQVPNSDLPQTQQGFCFELNNEGCTISEMKTLVNAIIKSLDKDPNREIAYNLNLREKANSNSQGSSLELTKEDSIVSEMKALVNVMIKTLDKDLNREVAFTFKVSG
ncbi:hypothetical protein [Viridibacillus arvi]|uniref:hypothetical protein n=1 Tax=Viridibacillus arvi TaxID=263475 RepID=UPI0034CD2DC2